MELNEKATKVGGGLVGIYLVYRFWKLFSWVRSEGSIYNAWTRVAIPTHLLPSIPIDNEKKVQALREGMAKFSKKPTLKVVHFTFPSRDTKGKVDLAVFFPPTPPHHHEEEKKSSLYPIIIWYHGGGMCIGDHRDALVPEQLALKCNAVVVSVGYRLAPATKFPGPVEDAYDALLWVNENASKINGDAKNISVIGESAGGNLAANVSILARDLEGPTISRMVLVSPWLDATLTNPSITKYNLMISQPVILWFRNNYIRTPKDIMDPRFSVWLTPNLSYLPKTLTIATDIDPLVDENVHFHQQLIQAGNSLARYSVYHNVPHAFYGGALPWYWSLEGTARRAHKEICDFLTS